MTRREKLITLAGIVVVLLMLASYAALYVTAAGLPG